MPIEIPETGEGGDFQGPQGESDGGGEERSDALQEDPSCEEMVESLEQELAEAKERIADLEQRLSSESRRYELERQLSEAGVVDLETALVLAERKLEDESVTVEQAVSSLKSSKGFLFRGPERSSGASALSGSPARPRDSLEDLAREARETGDRRAVLRYLRRRRG